ncbi:MAG: 30S ribosomal protein S21 [Gammaproteobacteria bacterium]|nr:30S ribosomal protein S21 [Gammaproteobacteria bacterium]|tara:strand:+ start:827 stop:1318 length:492 start_codon:yes stop_codon:yes gene_type:complete
MAVIRHSRKKANVSVKVHKNEHVDKAIKRFIRKCKKEGIVQQVRDRRYYKKPSEIRSEIKNKRLRDNEKENKKRAERDKKAEQWKYRPRRRYNRNRGPNRNRNQNNRNPNFKKQHGNRGPNQNRPSQNRPNKGRPNHNKQQQKKRVVDPNSPFAKLADVKLKE